MNTYNIGTFLIFTEILGFPPLMSLVILNAVVISDSNSDKRIYAQLMIVIPGCLVKTVASPSLKTP